MSALSKDAAKELQPFVSRTLPLMFAHDADHISLLVGDSAYEAAWYRADASTWSLHLTVRRAGESAEAPDLTFTAKPGDATAQLTKFVTAQLGALRAKL